jgi:hypothetical protein
MNWRSTFQIMNLCQHWVWSIQTFGLQNHMMLIMISTHAQSRLFIVVDRKWKRMGCEWMFLLCASMSMLITIVITTFTTHNIKIPEWYTPSKHRRLFAYNNRKIQAQNIENQNTCITKKTTKQKLCFGISNHQKWFEVTEDEIISHD